MGAQGLLLLRVVDVQGAWALRKHPLILLACILYLLKKKKHNFLLFYISVTHIKISTTSEVTIILIYTGLPIFELHKMDHLVYSLMCPASLSQHYVCEIRLCCCISYESFIFITM